MASITWEELGLNFGTKGKIEGGNGESRATFQYTRIETRQTGTMIYAFIVTSWVASDQVAERVVSMSKVLIMRFVGSADSVVCASIRCRLGAWTPKDELPRSEPSELRTCQSTVSNSGGAPGGVAPTGVGVKKT